MALLLTYDISDCPTSKFIYMKTQNRIKETLVDLIKVNTQRLQVYAIAVESWAADREDLVLFFEKKIDNIYTHIEELRHQLRALGEPLVQSNGISSKIFALWVDLKKSFRNNLSSFDEQNCLYTEEVVDAAYQTVLHDNEMNDYSIRQILADQCENIKNDLFIMKSRMVHS